MSRISFVFDRLPEFEVENSGQRVLVLLEGTRFAESFEKIPGGQILASVKTRKKSSQSVVELYFHNMPEFLDVHYDEGYDRLDLLVFWDKEGLAGRPSILDQGLGKLKPDDAGTSAQQVISSRYKGHWIDFFHEFEWPAEFSLPVRFSFPGFPSPLVRQYQEYVPDGFIKEGNSRSWARAAGRLRDLLAGHSESPQADLYRLLLAECLLRNKKYSKSDAVLEQIQTDSVNDAAISGWKAYFLAQAKARSGRPYQADTLLKEQEKTYLGVDGLAPWYALLQAELALAVDKKKPALKLLNREKKGAAFPFRL
ncbi:MAG: tetratricopeptide repeat protein, partial [Desulfohalobiaceae bacterium]|nr:tetratricopeptide repeat protein [Desulfohalobiaceae bacterium]